MRKLSLILFKHTSRDKNKSMQFRSIYWKQTDQIRFQTMPHFRASPFSTGKNGAIYYTKFLTVVVMQGWLLSIDCAFLPEESVAHSLVDWRLLDALGGSPLSSSSNQKELFPLAKWLVSSWTPADCLSDKAWHFYIQGEIRRPYRVTSEDQRSEISVCVAIPKQLTQHLKKD